MRHSCIANTDRHRGPNAGPRAFCGRDHLTATLSGHSGDHAEDAVSGKWVIHCTWLLLLSPPTGRAVLLVVDALVAETPTQLYKSVQRILYESIQGG